jgi:hypothetical protein
MEEDATMRTRITRLDELREGGKYWVSQGDGPSREGELRWVTAHDAQFEMPFVVTITVSQDDLDYGTTVIYSESTPVPPYMYTSAGGGPGRVGRSDNTMIYGVLGIVGAYCCFPVGIAFSLASLREAGRTGQKPTLARIGLWMGAVVAVLNLLACIVLYFFRASLFRAG